MTLSETQLKSLYIDFMKLFDGDCWIAGGAITNVYLNYQPADIDLFFPSVEARDAAVKVSVDAEYEIVTAGPNFIKLKDRKNTKPLLAPLSGCRWDWNAPRTRPKMFDAIYLGDTPQETLKKFDFTINQIAITKPTDTKPNGAFHLTPTAEEDLIAKTLKIAGEHPSRFLPNKARVVIKNLKKGFTIDTTELAKWFTDIPSNLDTSEKQIDWLINFITTYKK
tara:strand:+ start:73 stop:738 length:666 start_codon:yes stop_codon:yes gene_type:complete